MPEAATDRSFRRLRVVTPRRPPLRRNETRPAEPSRHETAIGVDDGLYVMSNGVSVGLDAVAISRVRGLLREFPEAFRDFAFSPAECRYCDARADPAQSYAGRWAVKEAYVKAMASDAVDGRPDLASVSVERDATLSLDGDGQAMLDAAAAKRGCDPSAVRLSASLTHEDALDAALGVVFVVF